MLNAVIAGNIGGDAKTNQAGQSTVTNFNVAVEQRGRDGKTTTWVRCALWGKRGEALRPHLTKGSRVCVSGEIKVDMYDGKPQVNLEASNVTLQGGGQSDSSQQPSQGGYGDQSGGYGGGSSGYTNQPTEMDDEIPF